MTNFSGTGVALITPFRKDGSIDFSSLEKLVNHVINEGVDFLVALGTTAETPTLNSDEKSALVDFICDVNDKRLPVVVGCGGNNTSALVKSLKGIDKDKVSAILSVAPYYNKPTQEGLYRHFKEVALNSPVPVIMYNVPGRTGSNISADTCIKLAKEFKSQIVAVKEASGDLTQIMKIIDQKPDDFNVLSGDDALTFPMITLGGKGVISVVANAYPAEFSQMVKHSLEGNYESARTVHYKMLPIIEAMFAEGNPTGLKAFLDQMGICPNYLRLPLVSASDSLKKRIKGLV